MLLRVDSGIPATHQVAARIDAVDAGIHGPGKVPLGKVPAPPEISVTSHEISVVIEHVPIAYDYIRIGNPKRIRIGSARKIERGYRTITEQERMKESVISHELADGMTEIVQLECLALVHT